MPSRLLLNGFVAFLCAGTALLAADDPRGVLTLRSGDVIPGDFRPAANAAALRWQGSAFVDPFEFGQPHVSSIRFPAAEPPGKLTGEFGLELLTGDVLTGKIKSWSADSLELDSVHFGTLHIQPQSLRRMYRLEDNPNVVLPALSGLTGWETAKAWSEDGPQIESSEDMAVAVADFDLPDSVLVEFEISWKKSPAFVLSIAADPDKLEDTPLDGWRFETWGEDLAIVREQTEAADVGRVQSLEDSVKKVHLFAYLDQAKGSMHIYRADAAAAPAAHIKLPPLAKPHRGRGIRLVNTHGDVRLERLRIVRWNGILPSGEEGASSHIQLADGSAVPGTITGTSQDGSELLLQHDGEERRVPLKDILSAELSSQPPPAAARSAVAMQDGTRVSGTLDATQDGRLLLQNPHITEPLQIPWQLVRSASLSHVEDDLEAEAIGRLGRLELGDLRLQGTLIPHRAAKGEHCLAFQPVGSSTGSPLRPEVSGRLVYRERHTPTSTAAAQRAVVPQPRRSFVDLFLSKTKDPAPAKLPQSHNLHLRSGDVIPCTISAIDEEGVTISSTVATATLVPHEKIKAAELLADAKPPTLDEVKKARLLTVPRLQQASPPTHLLCSRTGDFLRCRLIGLHGDLVKVEIQLEEMEIPLDRVAQIIWFHPDEMPATDADAEESVDQASLPTLSGVGNAGEAASVEKPADQPGATEPAAPPAEQPAASQRDDAIGLVQAIERNGNRITFRPEALEETTLSGHSDVLGECQVDVSQIDQLLIGEGIFESIAKLAYQDWRLRPAVEPLFAMATDESGTVEGTVSPLVGQPAPEIDLELLDGGRFKLSECRGQIVLLDFWATWCGPCMQTMPLVEEAMTQYDPEVVRLVSVNLEEPKDHIQKVLERHGLKVPVALDIDGVAAARYQATAIPQLVIIGRDGKVARLYIGGGEQVVTQLKADIAELLTSPTAGNE